MRKILSRSEAIELLSWTELPKLGQDDRDSILGEWWSLDLGDIDFDMLPTQMRKLLLDTDTPADPMDTQFDPLLLLALKSDFRGVRNDYLLTRLNRSVSDSIAEVAGTPEELTRCPCCGYKTLDTDEVEPLCRVCCWEADGGLNPDVYSESNQMTLTEARQNFRRIGASSEQALGYVDREGPAKYLR